MEVAAAMAPPPDYIDVRGSDPFVALEKALRIFRTSLFRDHKDYVFEVGGSVGARPQGGMDVGNQTHCMLDANLYVAHMIPPACVAASSTILVGTAY
jgi:hypothetical protein